MSRVLDYVAGWQLGRLPRLVLVPTGKLGAVPWHAARTMLDDGRPRYAIEDALDLLRGLGPPAGDRQPPGAAKTSRAAGAGVEPHR